MNISLNALSRIGNEEVSGGSRKEQAADAAASLALRQNRAAAEPNAGKNAAADKNAQKQKNPSGEPGAQKAYFAVDDNKNVVIKITDDTGKIVRQIPPEDYLKMAQKLDENIKSLFHKEA